MTAPDAFWSLITANYNPAELRAYRDWADALERLERRRLGWIAAPPRDD